MKVRASSIVSNVHLATTLVLKRMMTSITGVATLSPAKTKCSFAGHALIIRLVLNVIRERVRFTTYRYKEISVASPMLFIGNKQFKTLNLL